MVKFGQILAIGGVVGVAALALATTARAQTMVGVLIEEISVPESISNYQVLDIVLRLNNPTSTNQELTFNVTLSSTPWQGEWAFSEFAQIAGPFAATIPPGEQQIILPVTIGEGVLRAPPGLTTVTIDVMETGQKITAQVEVLI